MCQEAHLAGHRRRETARPAQTMGLESRDVGSWETNWGFIEGLFFGIGKGDHLAMLFDVEKQGPRVVRVRFEEGRFTGGRWIRGTARLTKAHATDHSNGESQSTSNTRFTGAVGGWAWTQKVALGPSCFI